MNRGHQDPRGRWRKHRLAWAACVGLAGAGCQFDTSGGGSSQSGETGSETRGGTSESSPTNSITVAPTTPGSAGSGATTNSGTATATATNDTSTTAATTTVDPASTGDSLGATGDTQSSSGGSSGGAPLEIGPFDTAEVVDLMRLPSARDDDPTLRADMLEMYFDREFANGSEGIWRTRRASVNEDWDPPESVTEFDTADTYTTPELSSDGLTIFFARTTNNEPFQIFSSTRANTDDGTAWATPAELVPGLTANNTGDHLAPSVSPDGLTAMFCADGPRLHGAQRANRMMDFAGTTPVTGSRDGDCGPWRPDDDSFLMFDGFRDGATVKRIYWTVPTSLTQIDEVWEVVGLPATAVADPWLSGDRRTLFFAASSNGGQRIMTATAAR